MSPIHKSKPKGHLGSKQHSPRKSTKGSDGGAACVARSFAGRLSLPSSADRRKSRESNVTASLSQNLSIPKTSFPLSQLNLHGRNDSLQTLCLRSFSRCSVQFGKDFELGLRFKPRSLPFGISSWSFNAPRSLPSLSRQALHHS